MSFNIDIVSAYSFSGVSFPLGGAMLDKQVQSWTLVNIPLSTLNRHGLITGATGTGKTKTLQVVCEQLSLQGVPVFMMDVKGDVSGLAAVWVENEMISWRMQSIGLAWQAKQFPVEFLTLGEQEGVKLRSTVSEMGPILIAKLLGLNETQWAVLAIIFAYCDKNQLLLIDLEDLKKTLTYISSINDASFMATYGQISDSTLAVITRSILELEGQWGVSLFGEPSFDIQDLMRTTWGQGIINILKTPDLFNKPKIYSSFLLGLLAECFNTLPEVGDESKPKLVMVIDEAHIFFQDLEEKVLDHITMIIKLIRSKGIGIIFCTQSPNDIPEQILGQLGLKIQHALRAFTPKDVKAIKLIEQTFPISTYYDIEKSITELGTGEALVTCIDERWYPTPVVHTLIASPSSRMWPLTDSEYQSFVLLSLLVSKYAKTYDPASAAEMLAQKIEQSDIENWESKTKNWWGFFKKIFDNQMIKTVSNYAVKEIARWALGKLGVKGTLKTTGTNIIWSLFGKLMK
jgi:hypothetical protein